MLHNYDDDDGDDEMMMVKPRRVIFVGVDRPLQAVWSRPTVACALCPAKISQDLTGSRKTSITTFIAYKHDNWGHYVDLESLAPVVTFDCKS